METTIDLRDQAGRQAPTPEGLRQAVINSDWRQALGEIVNVLEEDENETFAAQRAPDGSMWPPLAPYTIERKGHDTILQELGLLVNSLTDSTHPMAVREYQDQGEEKSIKFGTRRPFAELHDQGTDRLPKREFLGASDKAQERFEEIIDRHVMAVLAGEI
mgnify:CR=1 FL=1